MVASKRFIQKKHSLSNMTISKRESQSGTHARRLVMSFFTTASNGQEPLRENLSTNSGPGFPWPTDKSDDVYVKIAGLWRHGAIEYSTTTSKGDEKYMVRIPGVMNTTGSFHWFTSDKVVSQPPDYLFSLKEERHEAVQHVLPSATEKPILSVDVETLSLKQLRDNCLKRSLSKNGTRKKLENRLKKALEVEAEKQKWKAADSLPVVFVVDDSIYHRKNGHVKSYHHSEVGPTQAGRFGLQLYEFNDYIAASLMLRRYIFETPANSTKEFHGLAALTFVLALLKGYANESMHEIVKQEIEYAYNVAQKWELSIGENMKDKQTYDTRRKEVVRLFPKLTEKHKRAKSDTKNKSNGVQLLESLLKFESQLTQFKNWLSKNSVHICKNF
eukprot:UN01978